MIKIKKVKGEIRKRDLKRDRLFITIGLSEYHITQEEAQDLFDQLRELVASPVL